MKIALSIHPIHNVSALRSGIFEILQQYCFQFVLRISKTIRQGAGIIQFSLHDTLAHFHIKLASSDSESPSILDTAFNEDGLDEFNSTGSDGS